jgi:3'-phosphoadenosine 5'-phosphosulfate sulfotransferase (PAPS reductase)/FAD synthetase
MIAGTDPFLIHGPAVVSFSGGRTSGYLLWRVVQAHGGALPSDVLVCFANTGREHEGTLRFVRDCADHWGVDVVWLEYRRDPETGKTSAARVTYETAARNGEPFEAAIRAKNYLPRPVARFCTTELKIHTIRRWCVQQYGRGTIWTHVVGLRADEMDRVNRLKDPARQKKAGSESRKVVAPLADAGVTKADVLDWWSRQNFDLDLAGPWQGNCDGCFLKRRAFIERLWRTHPDRAEWWARMEREAVMRGTVPRVSLFRKEWRGGYAGIGASVLAQPELPAPHPDDDGLEHINLCDVGCGA